MTENIGVMKDSGDMNGPNTKSRRLRSNSSSNGSQIEYKANKTNPSPNKTEHTIHAEEERYLVRNKYTHVLVLKSLNNTFETKFLVIPFKPNGLKLGRPVMSASSSTSNGGSGKSDPQVKPDNGNFDSRVLSRNHASLTCDGETGKIYIHDLKSSNGTFLNGSRIGQSDVEIKVGDVIDLGTDIDTKFEHRKISALVEDISVIPLINETENILASSKRELMNDSTNNNNSNNNNKSNKNNNEPPMVTATSAQRAAFEAAMFGDVNNLDLEEAVLGSETEILSGIFINNSIGTSPNLINIIKTLVTDLTLEKLEFERLKSIDNFLVNYITKLEYLSKLRIEQVDAQLVQLQKNIKQKMTTQQQEITQNHNDRIKALQDETELLKTSLKDKTHKEGEETESLKKEIEELKTRLEVEKYKNSQLVQNKPTLNKSANSNIASEKLSKRSTLPSTGTNLLLLTSISAGALAAVFKYASK